MGCSNPQFLIYKMGALCPRLCCMVIGINKIDIDQGAGQSAERGVRLPVGESQQCHLLCV